MGKPKQIKVNIILAAAVKKKKKIEEGRCSRLWHMLLKIKLGNKQWSSHNSRETNTVWSCASLKLNTVKHQILMIGATYLSMTSIFHWSNQMKNFRLCFIEQWRDYR